MSVKTRDLGMTPLDDLFSTDESRAESQFEKVVTLNPAEISDFPNHPFKVKQDDAMAEMVESVRKYGVLVPALVRPKENGGYEMVAGHRRKFAAALAELTEIPCIVRNLSDDEATIIMVDSNLQRETILPSEKAFAYKMKLEAMKRQGQRTDLTSSPLDNKLSGTTSAQQLSQKSGDSQPQIYRFIRLTELIPPVLQMVDDGKIAFRPAVELSYLSKDQQQSLHDTMECEDCTPSLAQAIKMKEFSKDGRLTDEVILSIMQEEKPNQKEQFKMPKERISKYFAPGTPAQKIEDTIVKALEMYRKRERQRDTDGEKIKAYCRYIDETHAEIGKNTYHICEFAQHMEDCGATYAPAEPLIPEMCYSTLPSSGEVIKVFRGDRSYIPLKMPIDSATARKYADDMNRRLGVSKAQEAAMLAGSMFGWSVPAADAKNYDENGNPRRPKSKDRGDAR